MNLIYNIPELGAPGKPACQLCPEELLSAYYTSSGLPVLPASHLFQQSYANASMLGLIHKFSERCFIKSIAKIKINYAFS